MAEPRADRLLAFAAVHRLVVSTQVASLLDLEPAATENVLAELCADRLLSPLRIFAAEVSGCVITELGLRTCGVEIPVPAVDLSRVREAIAAGWAWVRARDGRFGDCGLVTEREMVAHDIAISESPRTGVTGGRPYGIRIGGFPASKASGLHHPDLLLTWGRVWSAVHIQLSTPASDRLAARLTAYGADERFQQLVFLVEQDRVGRQLEDAALNAGVAAMTSVQWVQW